MWYLVSESRGYFFHKLFEIDLTFKSSAEIWACYHSNESYQILLSDKNVLFTILCVLVLNAGWAGVKPFCLTFEQAARWYSTVYSHVQCCSVRWKYFIESLKVWHANYVCSYGKSFNFIWYSLKNSKRSSNCEFCLIFKLWLSNERWFCCVARIVGDTLHARCLKLSNVIDSLVSATILVAVNEMHLLYLVKWRL